jgi:2EXR family
MAATTFPRFSELPAELRDTIWELGLPGPARRHPELLSWREGQQNPLSLSLPNIKECPSKRKDPAMLQVNRESRVIAMNFYERREHFNCRYGNYFNFELDDFYFVGTSLFPFTRWRRFDSTIRKEEFNISSADRRRIINITIAFPWSSASASPSNFVRTAGDAFLGCLLNFECLKSITVEIWQDDALDIMDVMAPRMRELDVYTNRMLRWRLAKILDYASRDKADNGECYEVPKWRIQVVAGNDTKIAPRLK